MHARARELARPSLEQRDFRDAAGAYSALNPFWARVTDARCARLFGDGQGA